MPGSNVTRQLISQVLHDLPQSHQANARTASIRIQTILHNTFQFVIQQSS